ncbi:hypothetical protein IV417_02740 [Alphaproteobacteria bacterium KMM 3653]|uniref:Lysozyme inhibitor LprI N-terminal domain-containing protein n=1 Tax=Harenicola maris TaxID=2841044 RepID=A0AAP2G6Y0_9RHOB|nr:hypothetical protein [Harenicola maris]
MRISAALCAFAVMAGGVSAQTLQPRKGGAYDSYVRSAITCIARDHQSDDGELQCLSAAQEECQMRAGVYEACLEALAKGYEKAFAGVSARLTELGDDAWADILAGQHSAKNCQTEACRAEKTGEGLRNLIIMAKGIEAMRADVMYTPAQWRDVMLGGGT